MLLGANAGVYRCEDQNKLMTQVIYGTFLGLMEFLVNHY